MANNPNVNKVVYGNQTVMDISDTTATEGDVVSGKTFYKASGARSTGSAVIPDISNCYQTTDTAETTLDDADYFPFYDTSASGRRKTLWSNIIAKIKAALATVATSGSYYDLVDEPQNESATSGQGAYTVSLCTRMEKYQWNQAFNNTVKRHTGSALAGATSVYIPIDFATDHIVSIGADNGHDQILKYKTIGIYGGGGLPIQVGLTFSALAYDTDFEVLTI